jgi:hypothetical protein
MGNKIKKDEFGIETEFRVEKRLRPIFVDTNGNEIEIINGMWMNGSILSGLSRFEVYDVVIKCKTIVPNYPKLITHYVLLSGFYEFGIIEIIVNYL